ncbi:MAG: LPS export ABC transporter permease LptF [Pseudomonadota bacterium]
MRVIDRYLIKEVVYALLAVTPILLLIFISNRLLAYLAEAASGKLPADVIFTLLGLKSISVLGLILPLVFYLAIVFALGRLYKDSEMTVLAACGVSPLQIARIILAPALVLAVLVAALAMYVVPWASAQSKDVRQRAETGSELSTILPGRFKESRHGDHIFYAEQLSADFQAMRNVFVQSRQDDKLNIVSSEHGVQYIDKNSGDQIVVLRDGTRYEWTPNQTDFKIVNFKTYTLRITQKNPAPAEQAREARPTQTLLHSTKLDDVAELQWRISMPLSTVLLALLAVVLARTTPRRGRYAKLFAAVLIYIIYNNTMSIARTWVSQGVVAPWPGMWWVHGLVLIGVIVLFARHTGVRWLLQQAKAS